MRNDMKDVMLDFETLGNGKNKCVVQVGACYFDRETGEIGKTFEMNFDAGSHVKHGAVIDAQTVYWWLSQSREAIDSILAQPRVDIKEGFIQLNDFLKDAKQIWSHATFDFVTLTETLTQLDITPSFHYRVARDIRTIVDLAKITIDKQSRTGLHHNGLQDCFHQVKYCVLALNKISSSAITKIIRDAIKQHSEVLEKLKD